MPPSLRRYSYISTAKTPFGTVDLAHLRLSSENCNDRNDVTGLLLYDGVEFAQLIEGPTSGVSMIRNRIERDVRHGDLRVELDEPADGRHFSGWSLKAYWTCPGALSDRLRTEMDAIIGGVADARINDFFVRFTLRR